MGHVHAVVGKGKHIKRVMARPTAAERRHALKMKSPPKVQPASPQLARPQLVPRPQPPVQLTPALVSLKVDALAYLDEQHRTWCTNLEQVHLALNLAEKNFQTIMNREAAQSALVSFLMSAVTILVFAIAPELGPIQVIQSIAGKMVKEKETVAKLAEIACEMTKESVEQYKQKSERAEFSDDKAAADKASTQYFSKIYKTVSNLLNQVTNLTNTLSEQLTATSLSPADLSANIPRVYDAWRKGGLELKSTTASIQADQLGLFFLYNVMKQYVKEKVEIKARVIKGIDTIGPEPTEASSFSDKAKFTAAALIAKDKYEVPITKKEFYARRKQDPNFDVEFSGLDSARRQQMYDFFAEANWKSIPNCPLFDPKHGGRGWLDMIDNWEFASG